MPTPPRQCSERVIDRRHMEDIASESDLQVRASGGTSRRTAIAHCGTSTIENETLTRDEARGVREKTSDRSRYLPRTPRTTKEHRARIRASAPHLISGGLPVFALSSCSHDQDLATAHPAHRCILFWRACFPGRAWCRQVPVPDPERNEVRTRPGGRSQSQAFDSGRLRAGQRVCDLNRGGSAASRRSRRRR